VGALELPSGPEEADRPRQADGGGPPKPRFRELPDPDDRGRAYEAMRAQADAEAAARPNRASGPGQRAHRTEERPDATDQQAEATEQQTERTDLQTEATEQQAERTEQRPDVASQQAEGAGQRPDETGGRGYWAEVPRFRRLWGDHAEHWPDVERPAAAGRADDPPGSHCAEGERRPERRAETADAIGLMREAEPGISADAQRIARQNTCGAWLEGFKHRLKSEDRLKEKVAAKLRDQPDSPPADVVRRIPDTIRYTFCLEPERYTAGYYDIKQRLEQHGYEMYYSENWWTNPEYKGINTRWLAPEGQRFEVQFHTPESFHAKHNVTHAAYEKIRDPKTSRAELRELHAFQREVSAQIAVPDGATDIRDYRKDGF
jgi:hypothetical protein